MQDEVNEKVVSLCISGGKISARILKNVLMKYLQEVERREKQRAEKSAAKGDPDTSISYDADYQSFTYFDCIGNSHCQRSCFHFDWLTYKAISCGEPGCVRGFECKY